MQRIAARSGHKGHSVVKIPNIKDYCASPHQPGKHETLKVNLKQKNYIIIHV